MERRGGAVRQELVLQGQMNTAVFIKGNYTPNPVLSRAQTFLSLLPVERRERRSGICAHPSPKFEDAVGLPLSPKRGGTMSCPQSCWQGRRAAAGYVQTPTPNLKAPQSFFLIRWREGGAPLTCWQEGRRSRTCANPNPKP